MTISVCDAKPKAQGPTARSHSVMSSKIKTARNGEVGDRLQLTAEVFLRIPREYYNKSRGK